LAFSDMQSTLRVILHIQVAFIIVKIIITVNFPIKSTDEAPISLPTSITIIMFEKFIKNNPNP